MSLLSHVDSESASWFVGFSVVLSAAGADEVTFPLMLPGYNPGDAVEPVNMWGETLTSDQRRNELPTT